MKTLDFGLIVGKRYQVSDVAGVADEALIEGRLRTVLVDPDNDDVDRILFLIGDNGWISTVAGVYEENGRPMLSLMASCLRVDGLKPVDDPQVDLDMDVWGSVLG